MLSSWGGSTAQSHNDDSPNSSRTYGAVEKYVSIRSIYIKLYSLTYLSESDQRGRKMKLRYCGHFFELDLAVLQLTG